jgi:hypothetical protein
MTTEFDAIRAATAKAEALVSTQQKHHEIVLREACAYRDFLESHFQIALRLLADANGIDEEEAAALVGAHFEMEQAAK